MGLGGGFLLARELDMCDTLDNTSHEMNASIEAGMVLGLPACIPVRLIGMDVSVFVTTAT